ncbi:hypothetical protein HJC23_005205 [Cyclotella cryptica]|uniref:Uncharacterized protein n=1 Tax=Cyclotella cryptica TaxID=29204 RepID=A0ABD3P3X1_9STRA|eukprot:CCRYP_017809-RA/>CCRYP_017809-RA protein AED:0.03 eAED:0.03 QI:377/1/1/1/1/1/4/151/680
MAMADDSKMPGKPPSTEPAPHMDSPYYPEGKVNVIEDGPLAMNLGSYRCKFVTNIPADSNNDDPSNPRTYFDLGLRHFFSYQHEDAYKCFLACLTLAPDCAFAHGMVALCHGPNYNFKGEAYYESTNHPEEEEIAFQEAEGMGEDLSVMRRLYPSQQVASRHARFAIEKIEELKQRHRQARKRKGGVEAHTVEGDLISDIEVQLLSAIWTLTGRPGLDPSLSVTVLGRPYANALRKVYERFPTDAEVAYFFAESLMVLNAWNLYEFPTGKPLSEDIDEIKAVLENALALHPDHAGICHLYVHLCEMSSHPEKALPACQALRTKFPDAGHLVHMPTHIDVLVGDYDACVRYNYLAIIADEKLMRVSPDTAGIESFYFGYIVHNFHMLVYGAILGGMESIAMDTARKLSAHLNEDLFVQNPDLTAYLEAYSALDLHVMVRFGRWKDILQVPFPRYPLLMLCRSASLHFARGLALANTGHVDRAITEANLFDELRLNPSAEMRILHNNTVSALFAVDAPMLRGEIAYRKGLYSEAFALLRTSVARQDGLNYDEPWGKMQPVRHALGGLLFEQGYYDEGEEVFRKDLKFHPDNPFGLIGLILCLRGRLNISKGACCEMKNRSSPTNSSPRNKLAVFGREREKMEAEVKRLEYALNEQRKSPWADFSISVPCQCCTGSVANKKSD